MGVAQSVASTTPPASPDIWITPPWFDDSDNFQIDKSEWTYSDKSEKGLIVRSGIVVSCPMKVGWGVIEDASGDAPPPQSSGEDPTYVVVP